MAASVSVGDEDSLGEECPSFHRYISFHMLEGGRFGCGGLFVLYLDVGAHAVRPLDCSWSTRFKFNDNTPFVGAEIARDTNVFPDIFTLILIRVW